MELVNKTINLRDFGIGVPKTKPVNFMCPEDLKGVIPTSEYEGKTVIKWKTLVQYYRWLLNFIIESDYYVVRKKRDTVYFLARRKPEGEDVADMIELFRSTEPEGVFADTGEFTEATGGPSNDNCNKKYCINSNAAEFRERFGDIAKALAFIEFYNNAFEDNSSIATGTPFMEIPVLITESIENLGAFDIYDEFWVPGKEYKTGDTVYNQDEDGTIGFYRLKTLSFSGDAFDYDTWEKLEWEDEDVEIEGEQYAESQLHTLKRTRKSYDWEGNELPFFINDEDKASLPFIIGNQRGTIQTDGVYRYNVLTDVKFYDSEGEEIGGNFVDNDNNIVYDSALDNGVIIEFIYHVGDMYNDDAQTIDGVVYSERRYYTVEEYNYVEEEGSPSTLYRYINVDYDTQVDFPENAEGGVRYAKVIVGADGETLPAGVHLIKVGNILGAEEIKIDTRDVYVERGTAASYEAFNVLGEVNTVEDIEKYHDDWFRFKGKRD